jgi:hypothetical protein
MESEAAGDSGGEVPEEIAVEAANAYLDELVGWTVKEKAEHKAHLRKLVGLPPRDEPLSRRSETADAQELNVDATNRAVGKRPGWQRPRVFRDGVEILDDN